MSERSDSFLDRFDSYVMPEPNSGCWLWMGFRNTTKAPYGMMKLRTRDHYAHRVSYEIHRGIEIPDGLTIDHLCNNPPCVNPAHLTVTTLLANILRSDGISAKNARKTHCKRGHPLSGENLHEYIRLDRTARECRTCMRHHQVSWRLARKFGYA